MKILLIYPYCLEDRLQDYDVRVMPIGAYYIGAVLKANHHDVEILNWHNINKIKYGVSIWDGGEMTEELFKTCDVILATGSTIINDSLSQLISLSDQYQKPLYLYGTTIAGASRLLNLKRLCFQSS